MQERTNCSNGDKGPKNEHYKPSLKIVGNCDQKRSTVVNVKPMIPGK